MTGAATRRRGVLALLLAAALAALAHSASPVRCLGAAPGARGPDSSRTEGDLRGHAHAADSTAAAPGTPSPAEPGGPDVRSARTGGVAEFLDARPLARFVGSGRLGDRASLARGVLPAAMTTVVVDARRVDDRLTGGLAILSARALADGTLLVPSGPDLSLLPVRTASIADGPISLGARGAGPGVSAVVVAPGRLPGPTPWARISMGRGDRDWTSTGIEFGRRYREGGFGLSGFLERQDGNSPGAGGFHEIEHLGGRTAFELEGGWHAEIAAWRSSLDRSAPAGSTSIESDWAGSDVRLALADARSRLEVFHSGAWIRSGTSGGRRSAATTADGLSALVGIDRPPFDAVRLEVARISAEGSLLEGEEQSVRFSGLVSGGFPLELGSLALSAGGDWLGGRAVPAGAAALSGRAPGASWSVSAEVGGRHPTAAERLAAPFEIPGSGAAARLLRGNEELDPEVALVVRADYARLDLLSGVGVTGELSRVLGPVVVAGDGGTAARPVNGDDEVAGAASLWAAAGDSLSVGARATIDVFWTDDDGALVSLEPSPTASIAASGWVTSRFFEGGFLEVRWELLLRHEMGFSRGPWEGLPDDAVTSLDAVAAARAGPARIFLEVRDLLDTGGARVPDQPLPGRRIAVGFSTSLWN